MDSGPRAPLAHLVWDWNGTLLHDTPAVVAATNATFAELGLGLAPLTEELYRELYRVPVVRFYERVLGRRPAEAEWRRLDDAFQRHYAARLPRARLAEGAAELLRSHAAAGGTHSLCSLAAHDQLLPLVEGYGIARRFVRIDGSRTGPGGGKAAQLAQHLQQLPGAPVDRGRTVVIGDALDDAHAAARSGVAAVLYTGGSHSRAGLAEAGVPVVDSLAEAVAVANGIAAG